MSARSMVSVFLPPDLVEQIERVRKAERCTRSEVVCEALRSYFTIGRSHAPSRAEGRAIERGRAEIRRGEYVTLEELRVHVGAAGRKARRKNDRSRSKARA